VRERRIAGTSAGGPATNDPARLASVAAPTPMSDAPDERRRGLADRRRGTPVEVRRRSAIVLLIWFALASCIGIAMVAARVWVTETFDYGFLVWNLMLAWIPVVFAVLATAAATARNRAAPVALALAAVAWLLFFPNAPYIVTDFQHIGAMGPGVPTWYDVMVVAWFAFAGLFLGVVSLYLMQRLVERLIGRRWGWWFVIGVTAVASVGIYVGRFLRWNSWDVFSDPSVIANPVWERLRDPAGSQRLIAFTAMYFGFFLFVYGSLRLFAGLVREEECTADMTVGGADEAAP
jgi:uncharacterized membrane protein